MAGKILPMDRLRPPPLQQVTSVDGASAVLFSPRAERYNPDSLAARKGGLGIYTKMMQDEQVKAVVKFRRDSIVGRGYEFVFEGTDLPDEEQKARKRVMEETVRQLSGSFSDSVVGILSGIQFGFSVSEFVTRMIDVDGASFVGLSRILRREPEDFVFFTDEYGSLLKFLQRVNGREIELEYSRFVHYVQNPDIDAWYGESELRAAYRAWFMKDLDLRLWAAYKERMAGGFISFELGESGIRDGDEDYAALQSVLRNVRSTMGVILPKGVTATVTVPPQTDAYQRAIEFHDLSIAKALLIPNLLGLSHTGQTGAYSQSQTQLQAFFMTLVTDTQRTEECLNDQLFRPLAAQNWEDGEFPQFHFKEADQDLVTRVIAAWKDLTASGDVIVTEKDEAHLREMLNFPQRTADDVPIAKALKELNPTPIPPQFMPGYQPGQDPGQQPPNGQQQPAPWDGKQPATGDTTTKQPQGGAAPNQPGDQPPPPKKFSVDNALMRVDFAVIAQRTLAIEDEIVASASVLSARAARDLLTEAKMTEFLADAATIGALVVDPVSVGKMKAAFRAALERAWAQGLNQAMGETAKARKAAFSQKARFADLRSNAADWFDSKSFQMAGNMTDGMKAIVQQELLNAVKTGERPEEAAAKIYARLVGKGFTTLQQVLDAEPRQDVRALTEQLLQEGLGVPNVPAYLNTLVRTNTFEALNEARYAEFTDPALSDFVVALQYSAILDDRTTPICRELDQHIYAATSDVWDTYRPPNHYNCRSVVFAITALDHWDGVESPQPVLQPQDGFK